MRPTWLRIAALLLAVGALGNEAPVAAQSQAAPPEQASPLLPAARPCTPLLQVTNLPPDQSESYAQGRSYDEINAHHGTSFPNLAYFTGLNCVRNASSALIGNPPTYVSPCSAASGTGPPSSVVMPTLGADLGERANYDVESSFRDFRSLVYRLRTCDYLLSVIAWNTQGRGVTETLTYSWRVGCNSFINENATTITTALLTRSAQYVSAASDLAHAPKSAAALAAFETAYAHFAFARYDEYNDLSERLTACATVVANFAYPPNHRRFFCNYGGLIGALLTGSAIAFGKNWGTTTSTQSVVQGTGTVFIAIPALCQNAAPATGQKGG